MAKTPHRTIRIEDKLWNLAVAKAAAEGITISEVIRAALRRYLRRPTR
jgi:antitoxin component of RelBE/YafQ-DinJ toxin-antitoxin module